MAVLDERVSKLNVLQGKNEGERAAVVGKIDFITDRLKSFDQEFVSVLEALTTKRWPRIRSRSSRRTRSNTDPPHRHTVDGNGTGSRRPGLTEARSRRRVPRNQDRTNPSRRFRASPHTA